MTKIRRYIGCFYRYGKDETIIEEIDLPDIPLAELQELFSVPKNNPMYDCWDITPEHVAFFQNKINIEFNFDRYEYFLETSSI